MAERTLRNGTRLTQARRQGATVEFRERAARISTAIYCKGHVRRDTGRLRWSSGRQGLVPATCATSGGARAQGRARAPPPHKPRGGQLAGRVPASSKRHWRQELRWAPRLTPLVPAVRLNPIAVSGTAYVCARLSHWLPARTLPSARS